MGCTDDSAEPSVPSATEDRDTQFNRWAYGQMNHHYLWRTDMPDSLACDYSLAPTEFFKSLLSKRDRFSFLTGNDSFTGSSELLQQNYGFEFQLFEDLVGNVAAQVLYITSQRVADSGICRGDFLEVRGNHFTGRRVAPDDNGIFAYVDTPLQGIPEIGDETPSTIQYYSIIDTGTKRIGYVCYLQFESSLDIVSVLCYFSVNHIDELVLDLRYNPGGYVSTCRELGNWILPANAYGGIYQHCEYNDIITAERSAAYGEDFCNSYYEYPTGTPLEYADAQPLQLPRMFVLTSTHTASASEAAIVCMRPYMEVVQIGETTVGKGVGSYNLRDKRFPLALQPITMQYYNALGETTPDSGLVPDIVIEGTYDTSRSHIGELTEPLLRAALTAIDPVTFPPLPDEGARSRTTKISPIGEPSFVVKFRLKNVFSHDITR